MAIGTYAQLQAAIATRLHRDDLTANIVDYITLAEKSLLRTLGMTSQETEVSLTATISSRTLTPPTIISPLALYLTTYLPRIELEFRLPTDMQAFSSNGPSRLWTIDGTVIKTDTPADIAYTYTFRYVAGYDIASTSTNNLLTNYPDLYLYGALMEAADDIQDMAALARYQARYARALKEAADQENSSRSLAKLTTEFSRVNRPNIIRGF